MILALTPSALVEQMWPRTWPPRDIPAPSPLDQAADSLWQPARGSADSPALAVRTSDPLYSSQLRDEGQVPGTGAELSLLDQRIAIVRHDESHAAA